MLFGDFRGNSCVKIGVRVEFKRILWRLCELVWIVFACNFKLREFFLGLICKYSLKEIPRREFFAG